MCCLVLSEGQCEDPMVEVVRCEEPVELRVVQLFDLVRQVAVGISVDDRDLVPLEVRVQPISCVPVVTSFPRVTDARVRHLEVHRRLEIYVLSDLLKE
jgi:hypothetical protein